MTGKEIIDKAIVQSQGKWRPSPGLIYPMLGRLLDEGLIDELDAGRYKITQKEMDMTAALLEKIRENVEDKDIDSVFQTYISKTDDILIA